MGMSQAGMLLHASRFAERLGMQNGYEPGGNAVARIPLRGDVGFEGEE